jgi:hypothetical protein
MVQKDYCLMLSTLMISNELEILLQEFWLNERNNWNCRSFCMADMGIGHEKLKCMADMQEYVIKFTAQRLRLKA